MEDQTTQQSIPDDTQPHDLSVTGKDDAGNYVVQHNDTGKTLNLPGSYIDAHLPELKSQRDSYDAGRGADRIAGEGGDIHERLQGRRGPVQRPNPSGGASQTVNVPDPRPFHERAMDALKGIIDSANTPTREQVLGKGATAADWQTKVVDPAQANLEKFKQQNPQFADNVVHDPVPPPPGSGGQPSNGGAQAGMSPEQAAEQFGPRQLAVPSVQSGPPPGEDLTRSGLALGEQAARQTYANAQSQQRLELPLRTADEANSAQMAADQKARTEDLQMRMRDANSRYQALVDKSVQAANIDPEKFWKDKSDLGKAVFGVGAILSGIGGGLSGNPAAGAQFVNNKIQQNIDAQVKTAQNIHASAQLQGNVVQQLRNEGMTMDEAAKTSLAIGQQHTADQLAKISIQLADPKAKAAMEQQISTLRMSAATTIAGLSKTKAEADAMRAEAALRYAEIGKYGQMMGTQQADNFARQQASAGRQVDPAVVPYMSPEMRKNLTGDRYLLSDADKAKQVDTIDASTQGSLAALDRADHVLSDPDSSWGQKQEALAAAKTAVGSHSGLTRPLGASSETSNVLSEGADPRSWYEALVPGNIGRLKLRIQEQKRAVRAAGEQARRAQGHPRPSYGTQTADVFNPRPGQKPQ
jgi:hypothetical protein